MTCSKMHYPIDLLRRICIIVHVSRITPVPLSPDASLPTLSGSDEQFLQFLGRRVREQRNRRGMTRRSVAHAADVSERHLAQLEAGDGNISVMLLRRIAAALHVPLAQLLTAETEDDAGRRRIQSFLERLPASRIEEVLSRLVGDFGAEESARRCRIALVGLRGAGKSTLGARLAHAAAVPFIELDREIEKEMGAPLTEIFSLYGQSGYRSIEKRALERVVREHGRAILSVGGGIVSEKETYDYLLSNWFTVWIKAQPEEHMARVVAQGDFRAMAGNDQAMDDLRRILEAREPLYRKADLTLDTSGKSPDASFTELQSALRQRLR